MSDRRRKKLVDVLKKQFGGKIHSEEVNSKGRFRLEMVSPKFRKMSQLQRQDAVWAVVDKAVADGTLPREVVLDISLILTYSPADAA